MNGELLELTLALAVPLHVSELMEKKPAERDAYLDGRRAADLDLIAGKADVMLYGGGKKGEPAEVFNALARALAHLSFYPGGVKFLGLAFRVFPEKVLLEPGGEPVPFDDEALRDGRHVFDPERREQWQFQGEWGWRIVARLPA